MELQKLKGRGSTQREQSSPNRESAYSKLVRSSWRGNRPSRQLSTTQGRLPKKSLGTPAHEAVVARSLTDLKASLENSDIIEAFDGNGMSPLQLAAKIGFSEAVQLLLENGAYINMTDEEGSTSLNIALRYSREETSLALINSGADCNIGDANGHNALHTATKGSLLTIVQQLLQKRLVDVNSKDLNLNTALHFAVSENDLECCKILAENNAAVDSVNDAGETPLHIAAGENYQDTMNFLIQAKRNTQKKSDALSVRDFINKPRNDMKTALLLAAEMGHITTMNRLIDEGADIFVKTSKNRSLLHLTAAMGNEDTVDSLLKRGLSCIIKDDHGRVPLHEAVHFDHLAIVNKLLDAGAEIDSEDNEGHTPFLLAAKYNRIQIANTLLKRGAKPTAKDNKLKTALHYAVENGSIEAATFLAETYNKLIHAKDVGWHTPVHYAARAGHVKILKLFKKHSKQIHEKDNIGETPLHVAARYGNVSSIGELSNMADSNVIDCANPDGETPLHIAVVSKQLAACEILLKNKADVNSLDTSNWSPLHHAASQDDALAISILLKHKANIDQEDKWGFTPLMIAAKSGNVPGVVILLQNGASVDSLNEDGDTFLDIAIDYRQEAVCKAALENDRWREILSCKDPHGSNFMEKLTEIFPDVAEVILDRSTLFSDHHPSHPDFSVTFDYQFMEEKPESQSFMTDMLTIFTKQRNKLYFAPQSMAKYGREKLMSHPITADLFATKWHKIGRHFYYSSFAIYLFYVISMTILILMENESYIKVVKLRKFGRNSSEITKGLKILVKDSPSSKYYGRILGSLMLAFCSFQILKELVQLVVLREKYFKSFTNYVELCLYSVNVYYLVSFFSVSVVTRELSAVGVVCIFIAWTNLLLYLQRVTMFRLYIVMFIKVSFTIIKLLLVFVSIVVAFALTFYLLFIRQAAYRSVLASAAKVLVMMTGEFDFDDAISSNLGSSDPKTGFPYVPYPTLSYVIFVIFVFLVAVAFTNLLIGLAVGDIDEIRKIATVSIFEQELEFIDSIQGIVPKYILLKYVFVPETRYMLNKKSKFQRWKQILLPDSADEALKKLRMEQLDFDARKICLDNLNQSTLKNVENRREKLLERLLTEQQNMLMSILEEAKQTGSKEEMSK